MQDECNGASAGGRASGLYRRASGLLWLLLLLPLLNLLLLVHMGTRGRGL